MAQIFIFKGTGEQVSMSEPTKLKGVKRVEFRLDAETLEFIHHKQHELRLENKSEALKAIIQQSKSA